MVKKGRSSDRSQESAQDINVSEEMLTGPLKKGTTYYFSFTNIRPDSEKESEMRTWVCMGSIPNEADEPKRGGDIKVTIYDEGKITSRNTGGMRHMVPTGQSTDTVEKCVQALKDKFDEYPPEEE